MPHPLRTPRGALPLALLCALVLLLAAAGSAAAAPPRGQEALTDDPMATGPYGVQRASYDVGDLRLGLTASPGATLVPLRGSVTFPTGKADPSRVVVLLHGNHGTCRTGGGPPTPPPAGSPAGTPSTDPCPDASKVDSFAGYDYLSDNLASHGYVVVSPEANLAFISSLGPTTSSGSTTGSAARSQILQATLEAVRDWNAGAPVPRDVAAPVDVTKPPPARVSLAGRIDLAGGIGLMGHSRGGAGIVDFLTFNRNNVRGTQWLVDAALALEPTTYTDYKTPQGTNFGTLLGSCDGDMGTLEGANFFGLAKADPANARTATTQFYVEGANHNFYNTIWAADGDDAFGTCGGRYAGTPRWPEARLTEADQQKTGIALMGAFMRRFVGGETALDPLMTGETTLPASACPTGESAKVVDCRDLVSTSYVGPAATRLDVVGPAAISAERTAGGGSIVADGLKRFEVCDPQDDKPAACPRVSGVQRPSWGQQFTVGWDGPASLTAQLAANGAPTDLRGMKALQLRAALDYGDAANPESAPQDLSVTLTDADGTSARTTVGEWSSALHVPYKPQTVLNGAWIPLTAFAGVDLSRVVAVRFGFGEERLPKTGLVQLADVSFLRAPTPGAPDPVQPSIPAPDGPQPAVGTVLGTAGVGVPAAPGRPCRDMRAPRLGATTVRVAGRSLAVRGTARDRTSCSGGRIAGVRRVLVMVRQRTSGGRCRYLTTKGTWGRSGSCRTMTATEARGTTRWSAKVRLPKAGARSKPRATSVLVRAYDANGNLGASVRKTIRVR